MRGLRRDQRWSPFHERRCIHLITLSPVTLIGHTAAHNRLRDGKRGRTIMLTTLVGMPVSALDTPALLVDIEAMDRNIAHIAGTMREHGVQWRPHAKGHKCPAITHRQMAAGAIGVTVAKVSEAEVMAASGVMDILIANQVVGPIKTRRLAALIAATGADVDRLRRQPGQRARAG